MVRGGRCGPRWPGEGLDGDSSTPVMVKDGCLNGFGSQGVVGECIFGDDDHIAVFNHIGQQVYDMYE